MQIDRKDEQSSKAESPKRESLELRSKDKAERFVYPLKQCRESTSIDEGKQIDWSDEHH
jgi:hypothetical protein